MSKKPAQEPRIPRTAEDTRASFREQLLLMVSYCANYDAGQQAFAKPLSGALRLMIHQTGKSTSLLQQMKLRSGRFYSAAEKLNPRNLTSQCDLVIQELGPTGVRLVAFTGELGFQQRLPFAEWWSSPVLKGVNGRTMSRHDVVTAVANSDGAAHVDPGLDPLYASFRSGALLGWFFKISQDAPENVLEAPQYACIRTIAHEFLLTMGKYTPTSFTTPYNPSP